MYLCKQYNALPLRLQWKGLVARQINLSLLGHK